MGWVRSTRSPKTIGQDPIPQNNWSGSGWVIGSDPIKNRVFTSYFPTLEKRNVSTKVKFSSPKLEKETAQVDAVGVSSFSLSAAEPFVDIFVLLLLKQSKIKTSQHKGSLLQSLYIYSNDFRFGHHLFLFLLMLSLTRKSWLNNRVVKKFAALKLGS